MIAPITGYAGGGYVFNSFLNVSKIQAVTFFRTSKERYATTPTCSCSARGKTTYFLSSMGYERTHWVMARFLGHRHDENGNMMTGVEVEASSGRHRDPRGHRQRTGCFLRTTGASNRSGCYDHTGESTGDVWRLLCVCCRYQRDACWGDRLDLKEGTTPASIIPTAHLFLKGFFSDQCHPVRAWSAPAVESTCGEFSP